MTAPLPPEPPSPSGLAPAVDEFCPMCLGQAYKGSGKYRYCPDCLEPIISISRGDREELIAWQRTSKIFTAEYYGD